MQGTCSEGSRAYYTRAEGTNNLNQETRIDIESHKITLGQGYGNKPNDSELPSTTSDREIWHSKLILLVADVQCTWSPPGLLPLGGCGIRLLGSTWLSRLIWSSIGYDKLTQSVPERVWPGSRKSFAETQHAVPNISRTVPNPRSLSVKTDGSGGIRTRNARVWCSLWRQMEAQFHKSVG